MSKVKVLTTEDTGEHRGFCLTVYAHKVAVTSVTSTEFGMGIQFPACSPLLELEAGKRFAVGQHYC